MHLNFHTLPAASYSNCYQCLKKLCLKTQPSSEFFHRWSLQKALLILLFEMLTQKRQQSTLLMFSLFPIHNAYYHHGSGFLIILSTMEYHDLQHLAVPGLLLRSGGQTRSCKCKDFLPPWYSYTYCYIIRKLLSHASLVTQNFETWEKLCQTALALP